MLHQKFVSRESRIHTKYEYLAQTLLNERIISPRALHVFHFSLYFPGYATVERRITFVPWFENNSIIVDGLKSALHIVWYMYISNGLVLELPIVRYAFPSALPMSIHSYSREIKQLATVLNCDRVHDSAELLLQGHWSRMFRRLTGTFYFVCRTDPDLAISRVCFVENIFLTYSAKS